MSKIYVIIRMSLPRSPSQFELARSALAIGAPPQNNNWSTESIGERSPNSPYVPPVFNRLSSYKSIGKNVTRFRKNRKGSRRANRKASRKNRKNRKASRKNRN